MALIENSTQLDTPFLPETGDFWARVSQGAAQLESASSDGEGFNGWAPVREGVISNESVLVRNPVPDIWYRWTRFAGLVTTISVECRQ